MAKRKRRKMTARPGTPVKPRTLKKAAPKAVKAARTAGRARGSGKSKPPPPFPDGSMRGIDESRASSTVAAVIETAPPGGRIEDAMGQSDTTLLPRSSATPSLFQSAIVIPPENGDAGRPPMNDAQVPGLAAKPSSFPLQHSADDSPVASIAPADPIGDGDEGTPGTPQSLLFECAWEVCWQLGGIYTVLRTKVEAMQQRWGDRYYLIGPYNPSTAALEFEETPSGGFIRDTLDDLRRHGIHCHHGRWLVPGRPRVILLDYRGRYGSLEIDKYLLWKDHGIPTEASDGEVNDVVAFGFTVTEFFRHLRRHVADRPVLAHFHEWMGGVAVPRIAHERIGVTTVFTTHATLLGRYLASDDPNFYSNLPHVQADAAASHYNIYPRFAIERTAAHAATVFTTVSQVTSVEADKLLGRLPDVVLPNGLNIRRFAATHEFQALHRQYKDRIHEFVMGHFFPAYTFDLDRTIYLFTSGRYEYRNKGFDLFIESLWRLNNHLRMMENPPTVVAFLITRAATRHVNVGVLQSHSMFEDLKSACADIGRTMGRTLFGAAARGRLPSVAELVPEEAQVRLKRAIHTWRDRRQPPIVTHDMADDAGDPVLRHLRHRRLFNAPDDPVKVIFHPEFVTLTSPLIGLDYEQFVRGCHMGIFPSYYEPWGYTPMEAAAMGLPAITTDLSGFGAWLVHEAPDAEQGGLSVINRRTQSFDRAADDIADRLKRFTALGRRQRIELRNRVELLSERFDWSNLIRHYHEAHDLALSRTSATPPGKIEIRVV